MAHVDNNWGMVPTDEDLVKAALSGDTQSFAEIVRRYERLVFNIVYHYMGSRDEVEDQAQEVFLKVYRALPQYDTGRPLKAWISRITVNTCLDELRRRRGKKAMLFSQLSNEEEDRLDRFYDRFEAGEPLTEARAAEFFDLLQRLMSDLGDKDRMAFLLREIEGQSYAEIAAALDTSEVAVRIRVSRSRGKLLKALESHLAAAGSLK